VDPDERKLLEALRARRLRPVEIQRQTGLEAGLVARQLLALYGRGLVSWDVDADRGVWTLTTAGREAMRVQPAPSSG
jgi:DNA-binding IclR family transcriptional regulator